MRFSLPPAVQYAINKLNAQGHEAYVVGGCVRDTLLGQTPQDWDITTSALPQEVLTVFASERCIPTGLSHGTVTVVVQGQPLEVTTYRIDGIYSDGRHPDYVTFSSFLEEDIKRRDFTINAMAYHPDKGLVDLYGGQKDLQNRCIRCVGNPHTRFTEDALRILRALRFASTLGFTIEKNTAEAIRALASSLSLVAMERITAELKKFLCGNGYLSLLGEYDTVFSSFLSYNNIEQLADSLPADFSLRLAAVLSTSVQSSSAIREQLQRLRLDRDTERRVLFLLEHYHYLVENDDISVLHLLQTFGPEDSLALLRFQMAIFEKPHQSEVYNRTERLLQSDACYSVAQLKVSGNDLIALGYDEGKILGSILQELLEAVITGQCLNDKAALLSLAAQKGRV